MVCWRGRWHRGEGPPPHRCGARAARAHAAHPHARGVGEKCRSIEALALLCFGVFCHSRVVAACNVLPLPSPHHQSNRSTSSVPSAPMAMPTACRSCSLAATPTASCASNAITSHVINLLLNRTQGKARQFAPSQPMRSSARAVAQLPVWLAVGEIRSLPTNYALASIVSASASAPSINVRNGRRSSE